LHGQHGVLMASSPAVCCHGDQFRAAGEQTRPDAVGEVHECIHDRRREACTGRGDRPTLPRALREAGVFSKGFSPHPHPSPFLCTGPQHHYDVMHVRRSAPSSSIATTRSSTGDTLPCSSSWASTARRCALLPPLFCFCHAAAQHMPVHVRMWLLNLRATAVSHGCVPVP